MIRQLLGAALNSNWDREDEISKRGRDNEGGRFVGSSTACFHQVQVSSGQFSADFDAFTGRTNQKIEAVT